MSCAEDSTDDVPRSKAQKSGEQKDGVYKRSLKQDHQQNDSKEVVRVNVRLAGEGVAEGGVNDQQQNVVADDAKVHVQALDV